MISSEAPATGGARSTTIGRDLLPAGRVVRFLAGLILVAAAASTPHLGALTIQLLGQVALAFVVTAIAYTILARLLGERLLARVDPWLGAIVLVAPATVLLFFLPASVTAGYDLYIGISLLVQAVIRYGGCEILGIPTLLLRRRYTVYCVFNGADLVERRLRDRPRWVAWTLVLLTFGVTMVLLTLAASAGSAGVERILYLLFLVIGLLVNRVVTRSSRRPAGGPAA